MFKATIRKLHKSLRLALSEESLHQKSQQLVQNFWQSGLLEDIGVLHLFLPIRKLNEPDTWLLVEKIWQEKPSIRLAISKSDFTKHTLTHYFLEKETPLQENSWGIVEPDENQAIPCPTETIEMVLIPLLGFDARGYRIGYGKGFYDRFLAQCPLARKVGFSLEEVLPEAISDTDEHDVRLDCCITPSQVIFFAE